PYVREPAPKKKSSAIYNPPTSETGSSNLNLSYTGDSHNILMYEAYRNDITADLDEDNLNTELVELLTSTSIPNMTGNQVSIYNSIKSNLYNQLVLINNFKSTGSLDMIELLNSTSVSNNSKRSEERRVGKECRYQRSQCNKKQKRT